MHASTGCRRSESSLKHYVAHAPRSSARDFLEAQIHRPMRLNRLRGDFSVGPRPYQCDFELSRKPRDTGSRLAGLRVGRRLGTCSARSPFAWAARAPRPTCSDENERGDSIRFPIATSLPLVPGTRLVTVARIFCVCGAGHVLSGPSRLPPARFSAQRAC